MKSKSQGFTLLELVVVIVILGILAVTAAPRFLGVQRDAHEALAQGAFAAFRNSIDMYHSQWLVDGEPNFDQVVDYGEGDVYPSLTGFPISVQEQPTNPPQVSGDQCVALWNSLIDSDLVARSQNDTGFILPSDEAIVSWYNGQNECFYYYTPSFTISERLPILYYSPITGEVRVDRAMANTAP
ncbi:MSHA pilin protein MshB [Vibrio crassostreae]|uniref:type II secretion system protein n=1 Tax=Vibrio crassostreae TaxID=246167 RepID=UPI0005E60652|nr:type II secretion system protein [Vibrio crassostreae]TCT67534.1 prepilin-type N-terminal cleavage/methylation domain-containing protein [Vibrio crassostreae]TCT87035.1 prepilin-type N-terminal cleavage/methylation domain-containing protein [Vibrio crassostreae]TCU07994.1 prepilin-type N-terminal cleavage/methylation domain-containing protein [Vibrio crassostreae]TDW13400.1 prepilin-type N-terminal cleavage/methylation domain-containing protein [Vibrio crassostreae]CAK1751039.1 MSHA pilin p